MNKKAQAEYLLENGFRIGFMVVALLAFFLLINLYINNSVDTQALQAATLRYRILYSDAIMQTDESTGLISSGIIDMKKFDSTLLASAINYGQFGRHAAVKLKLYAKPVKGEEKFLTEAYLNKDQFDNWIQLRNQKGKGIATMFITKHPVTYRGSDGVYQYGTLIIEIVIPNS